jgi:hypothetical protein
VVELRVSSAETSAENPSEEEGMRALKRMRGEGNMGQDDPASNIDPNLERLLLSRPCGSSQHAAQSSRDQKAGQRDGGSSGGVGRGEQQDKNISASYDIKNLDPSQLTRRRITSDNENNTSLELVGEEVRRAIDSSSVSQNILERALVKLSIVLYELLNRDRHARLNERLKPVVETLTNAAEIISTETPSPVATLVNKFLGEIHQMVARAKGPVQEEEDSDDDHPTNLPRVTSSYPRDPVVPNNRRDNDKKDITNIVIFPTRDEIMSDAKEFLPSTDPNQPHFITNQVERHIDIQFRLLRHDIFGEQKSALARCMHAAAEDPTMLSHSRFSLGDTRVYNYSNAHVSYLPFDKRRELEALVSFPHPPAVRKQMDAAKQAWWEESKRLEEGSLLSFIWIQDAVVEHLFLTVSDKKTRPDKEGGGLTDRGP